MTKSIYGLGHVDNFDRLYDAVSTGALGLGLVGHSSLDAGLNADKTAARLAQAYEKAKATGAMFLADVEHDLPDSADSVSVPLGALNFIDPEIIDILKAPMSSDLIAGTKNVGPWGVKTIEFQTVEPRGETVPYIGKPTGSESGVNYNPDNFRAVYYHQTHWSLNEMEIARAALARRPILPDSQRAAIYTIKKTNDKIFFNGLKSSADSGLKTEGLLTASGLAAYQPVAGGTWSAAIAAGTPEVIVKQIGKAFEALDAQNFGRLSNEIYTSTLLSNEATGSGRLRLVIPSSVAAAMQVSINEYGLTLRDKLNKIYNGKLDVVSTPFFNGAGAANANVMYMIYTSYDAVDTVTKGMVEEVRLYPTVNLHAVSEQLVCSGTVGAIVKRPIMVSRWSGI